MVSLWIVTVIDFRLAKTNNNTKQIGKMRHISPPGKTNDPSEFFAVRAKYAGKQSSDNKTNFRIKEIGLFFRGICSIVLPISVSVTIVSLLNE